MPIKNLTDAPVYKASDDLLEFPVTGCVENPFQILDTWGYYESPHKIYNEADYIRELEEYQALSRTVPLILNVYGDPSHIAREESFFQAMEMACSFATPKSFLETCKEIA